MGQPSLTPAVKDLLVAGMDEEIGSRSYEDLVEERAPGLVALLHVRGNR